ncbi:hypothetical protein ABPG72_018996 [Tetrahymena utriculariae]
MNNIELLNTYWNIKIKAERIHVGRGYKSEISSWIDNCKSVLFTDECKIIYEPSYQKYIWCETKDQINKDLILPKEKHPLKVHIWKSISYSGSLQLTKIFDKMDCEDYLKILEDLFEEQEEYWNQNRVIFQQDNSSVHTVGIISEFLAKKEIELLEWPSKSPDLSPIENL